MMIRLSKLLVCALSSIFFFCFCCCCAASIRPRGVCVVSFAYWNFFFSISSCSLFFFLFVCLFVLSFSLSPSLCCLDFGLAKYRGSSGKTAEMTTACGTPGYVAPEVLKNEPYGNPVDLWSLGVILYILLCGFPPFYHESTAALYKQIKKGEFDFPAPYWSNISASAKDLVKKLLTVDPNQRYTAKQVLSHSWVSGSEASSAPLGADYNKRLLMLQARRRLKKGVQMIIAVNKFSNMLDAIKDAPDDQSLQSAAASAK